MKGIEDGSVYWEYEDLSIEDRYNEYLLTGLRSKWGCDMDYIRNEFGEDLSMNTYLLKQINLGTVILDKGVVRLSESGMLLADRIASELFKEA